MIQEADCGVGVEGKVSATGSLCACTLKHFVTHICNDLSMCAYCIIITNSTRWNIWINISHSSCLICSSTGQVKATKQCEWFLTYIWLYLSVIVYDLSVSEDIDGMGSLKHHSKCRWWWVSKVLFSFYDIESTGTKTKLDQGKFCGGLSAFQTLKMRHNELVNWYWLTHD